MKKAAVIRGFFVFGVWQIKAPCLMVKKGAPAPFLTRLIRRANQAPLRVHLSVGAQV